MLSLTLLGQVVLSKGGLPLSQFRSQKEVALLVYLAQTGQTHQRDFLADLLWESSSTKQSMTNLRTVLSRLRKQVGDALQITRKTVALTPETIQQVDSFTLLHGLTSVGQIDTAVKATTLQETLATYHDHFLTDFYLPDATQFNDWVLATREHIRRQVIVAYDKLGQYALSTRDAEYGITIARLWLKVDGLDETAHTLLIQQLLELGNEREAAAHYDHCAQLLHTELGIEPSAKMTALIKDVHPKQRMRSRELVTGQSATAQSATIQSATVRHNLPAPHDQFFGRETVQQAIQMRLDQPWCRLVTIVGQGGVGKTRLATIIARSRLAQYPDGAWLVELADIDPDDDDLAETIAVEIAIILDLRLSGSATPAEQLFAHLQHKQVMLVLDNFEHLLAGMQVVLDIIERCEKVQLLLTSREALNIRAEWTVGLTGLGYPTSDTDEIPSDAVELFMARQAQQRQEMIAADELTAIRTICRRVAGLPLAIELAAALTRHASPRAIADSLRDRYDALTTSLHDVPERHRGLHIVFEMSWRTLTLVLQTRLAQLSVFRGGFTQTAVIQITETDKQHLTALCEKSLLTFHAASDRYTFHPVIRAYAAEKRLDTDPTPQKHAHYYLILLAQHTEPLQKKSPQISISVLEPDIDNVRRAWQTGLAERNVDLLFSALTSLSIYYQLRGLAHEGEAVMQSTASTATAWGADGLALATHAGLERARFQNRLGQYRPAMQTIKTMLKLAAQCADHWAEGMGHVWWGESLWRLGEYDAAKKKLTKALNIAHALEAPLISGWCHHQLGIIHDIQSYYDTAHGHLEKACATWRALDNNNLLSVSFNSIGLVQYHQGNLSAAKKALERSLTLCNQIDNRHLQAWVLSNLSIIATEQGDHTGADYYLQLSAKLATTNGNLTAQGDVQINLGRNYRMMDETDLAVESLEHGLGIAKSLGNRSMIVLAMYNLAEIKREQGDLKKAESLYDQVLKIAQQDNLQNIVCEALIGLAKLLSITNVKRAKESSARAVTLAMGIQNPILLEQANAIDRNLLLLVDFDE